MGLLGWLFGQEKKGKPDVLERPKASEARTNEESGGESNEEFNEESDRGSDKGSNKESGSRPAMPVFLAGNIQGIGDREQQEDSFAVFNVSDTGGQETKGLLAVVADGMGGMADGQEASRCTVDTFSQRFRQWNGDTPVPEWLYTGAFEASRAVFSQTGGRGGSTLTAVHLRGDQLYWLSVGDSAIYLMRNGGVFQLNREHTYLNQLYSRELEEPVIDRSRAELDEDARRLTSFVGIDDLKEVDFNLRPWTIKPGDVLLLCSDGISGILSPPELMEAMSLEPHEGCALLETMVLEKQVPEQDNYTGVMIACR